MKKNQNTTRIRTCFALIERISADSLKLGVAVILLNGVAQNPAQAAGIVGNGNPGSCNNSSLNTAMNGGGNVTFNCGNLAYTIVINEKIIAANTVIDGGNLITLSGGNGSRLFKVNNGKNLTVKNITLTKGYTAGQGAAIYAAYKNTITISRSKLTNNVSTQLGEAGGGAIYSSNGSLAIDNSSFSDNTASIGGAMRILNSNLSIVASAFTGNKAVGPNFGSGGAIGIDGANGDNGGITIRNSSFKNNSAKSYGGALFNNIYNNNKTLITNSVFDSNYVGGGTNGQGGAIWSNGDPAYGGHWTTNSNNTTLTLVNTTLANNTASQQGGGVFIARHPKGAVISQSAIYGNQTQKSMGAGLLQTGNGNLTVVNSTFSQNRANGTYSMGAGMYIGSTAKATITNVTVADNIANWQAGGIYGAGNVTLKNTILANNVALNGGNNWNIKHNCFQPMNNGGNNLQYPNPKDAACTANIIIEDPKLGALANNGGATLTRALSAGSAATQRGANCQATDQRGVVRAKPAGTYCDIGAFEANF